MTAHGTADLPSRVRAGGTWWFALSVAVLTLIAFAPALQNGFVSWDDDKNFLANPDYRGLGWPQLRWMWSTFHLGHYVPLSWMTLGLDYELWGMDPRGYHLTSVLFHTANAVLVFFVARRLLRLVERAAGDDTRLDVASAFAAAVFAIHPLRVESVAWITERRDVLSGCFYSLSVLLYLQAVGGAARNARRYQAALVACLAALLSKATSMTLPAVLLLLNVYPLRRLDVGNPEWRHARVVLVDVLPFALLSGAFMVLSLVALDPPEQLGPGAKAAIGAYGLAFYLLKTIVPTGLAAYYPLPSVVHPAEARFLVAYAVIAALSALAWLLRRRSPGVVAALAAFVVVTLPMLGVVQNGPQIAADRYTYHAAPALAILAGGAVAFLWGRRGRRRVVAGMAGAALLLPLGLLTWRQTQFWHDSERLWTRVIEVSDDAAIAHNALGNLRMDRDNVSHALKEYERAVRLDPGFAAAHDNLGVALARLGRLTEAVEHFARAVELNPSSDEAHNNWGVTLATGGDLNGAIGQYRRAIELNGGNANAQTNWANALVTLGRTEEALPHYARAVAIHPQLAEAHANWGASLARLHRWHEAREHLTAALRLNPGDAEARSALERVNAALAAEKPGSRTTVRP